MQGEGLFSKSGSVPPTHSFTKVDGRSGEVDEVDLLLGA